MQDNDDVTGTMDPARARPESAIDDESLFARVAAGDSQALRRFYQLYYRRLHRFLLRITLGYPDRAAERNAGSAGMRRVCASPATRNSPTRRSTTP